LWEGGIIGEGILRSVKPLAPRYAKHPFELLLTRFYQARALTRAKLRNDKRPETKFKGHEWMDKCQVYKKMDDVQLLYLAHDPIMIARLEKKRENIDSPSLSRFVILLPDETVDGGPQDPNFPYVACGIRRTQFRGTIGGCAYFDWFIEKYEIASIDTSTFVFTHSILLCPAPKEFLISQTGNGKPYYSVTAEYDEISPIGTISRDGFYDDTLLLNNKN
jgi:hypothetical protein